MKQHRRLIDQLLGQYGRTYAEEVGINVERNSPSALFQLLCTALLLSARIAAKNGVSAARALREARLTTANKMAQASWQDRVDVITWHGYKRYDERTSTFLGEAAQKLLKDYRGDLRRLRERAAYNAEQERVLLMEFKGIGPIGADIFLREVQLVWDEVYPFADARVLKAAKELGLPDNTRQLAKLVPREKFPALLAALIRVDLGHAYDELHAGAAIARR